MTELVIITSQVGLIELEAPGSPMVLEVSAPAGPHGALGPTGPAGTDGFVVSYTEPPNPPDGLVWVQPI